MKTLLCFAVFFLLTSVESAFSQEYHPMLRNSTWLLYDWTSHGSPSEERMIEQAEDIIIGSYTYKKYIDQFPSYDNYSNLLHTVYLREDVAERKVYKIVDSVDLLLYDFNLENGSTIYQYGNTFTAAVDYIFVNGGTRKRITLKSTEEYCGERLTQVWIEGVGSDKHPFYPDYSMYNVCSASGGTMVFTKCSFQNGEHIFGNPDCLSFIPLGVEESDTVSDNISVSPNPFVSELSIESAIAFDNVSLKLYNAVGQLVREINNISGQRITLNRENLNSGLYFIQLFEKGKLVKSSKVLVD
ncbi:MAG: T9SS type A sorting domain-containing protein [Flavobacterium sp.]|nr:T9SS type A sorting domain-containing protein [Flavobacterium sp.]